jgi:DNA-binding response OmpR family regulator
MTASPQTILIVDDELATRKHIRAALQGAGYRAIEASEYKEAAGIYERLHDEIDLLIVDVSLPDRNGCELAQVAQAIKPGVKILLISGQTGAEVCKFYGIPATDVHFLGKPFRGSTLLARVKYVLGSAEPLAGTATGSVGG